MKESSLEFLPQLWLRYCPHRWWSLTQTSNPHYQFPGCQLLPLKSLIKEVIDNLVIDSEKLKFVSISTVYEDNNGAIVLATSPRMTPSSKHIAVKYHWFRQHVGKEFVIRKIESENQKADVFTKVLQGQIFVRIRKLLCGW